MAWQPLQNATICCSVSFVCTVGFVVLFSVGTPAFGPQDVTENDAKNKSNILEKTYRLARFAPEKQLS